MNENEKNIVAIVAASMIALIVVAILCNSSNKDFSTPSKRDHSIITGEVESSERKDEAYYRQKGYQIFSQYNLAIKTPITLKDISFQSSNDFDLEYGAIENENNPTKMAVYQLMVIELPISYRASSHQEKEQVRKSILDKLTQDVSSEYVRFSHEELDAYVAYTTFNGYGSKCIYFFREDYVFCLVVISNNNLNERFNKLTNSIHFYDDNTIQYSSNDTGYKIFENNAYKEFSIKYPKNYEVVSQPNQGVIAAFISPEDNYNFRSNFNIIMSNTSKNIADAALLSIQQMQSYFDDFEIISQGYLAMNNLNYYQIIADYTLSNYPVRAVQYATTKDGILYIITFTVAQDEYASEEQIIKTVIESFKIN
ncbi:PsbP-related protein [Dysgonomonas sp. Marseille-P4361]|uniref:PsbP-related protein n=1 Tax=Dysgonomonas sp. Marseille-P4361 TaxID=2161820 RepID=UPI000D556349|nr:PsbP-related protein [Dysgonomonas sp. Marseille-P4361]